MINNGVLSHHKLFSAIIIVISGVWWCWWVRLKGAFHGERQDEQIKIFRSSNSSFLLSIELLSLSLVVVLLIAFWGKGSWICRRYQWLISSAQWCYVDQLINGASWSVSSETTHHGAVAYGVVMLKEEQHSCTYSLMIDL